jgi:hypothetical protein
MGAMQPRLVALGSMIAALGLIAAFWLVATGGDALSGARGPADQLRMSGGEWRLFVAGFACLLPAQALLFFGMSRLRAPVDPAPFEPPPRFGMLLFVAALALLAVVRYGVLGGGPLTDDEWAYHFQARTFAGGALFAAPPPDAVHFDYTFLTIRDARWFCTLQPGLAALMTPGVALLDDPFLSLWPLHALLPVLTFRVGRRLFDDARGPALAALLLLVSPWYLLTGGTVEPYVPFAVGLLGVAGLAARVLSPRADEGPALPWAGLLGLLTGGLMLLRPLEAGVIGLALAIAWALTLRRPGTRAALVGRGLVFALGLLPAVALQLAYNRALTGDALTVPMLPTNGVALWGFGPTAYHGHDLFSALRIWGGNAGRALLWLTGAPWALVMLVWALRRPGERLSAPTRRVLGFCLLLFAALLPYTMAGVADFGPVYLFAMAPLLLWAVCDLLVRAAPAGGAQRWVLAGLAVSMLGFSPVVTWRAARIAWAAQAPYAVAEAAAEAGAPPSLVLVRRKHPAETGWVLGVRAPRPELDDHTIFVWATPGDAGFSAPGREVVSETW